MRATLLPCEVFLIFTTHYTHILVCFFLFVLVSDEPEVFLPKYSQTANLHAPHFRRVVKHVVTHITQRIQCLGLFPNPVPPPLPHTEISLANSF